MKFENTYIYLYMCELFIYFLNYTFLYSYLDKIFDAAISLAMFLPIDSKTKLITNNGVFL